jgi:hypothetical protein
MPKAAAWFDDGNDMYVRLDTLKSSTMGSTSYLNSSTGVTCEIWQALTTASTSDKVVTATNVPYIAASNGRYELTIHSTAHSMARGVIGMARVLLSHSGLNGEWRARFRVETRIST